MEEKLDTWLYKDYEDGVEISGGEAQKLALARALYKDAPVVVLDEPTAGLDPKERGNLRNYIRRISEDKIILLATHVVSDVESIADRILIMKDGKLAADDVPAALIEKVQGNNLEDVYMYYFGENSISPGDF